MEVVYVNDSSIKIKTKQIVFAINPQGKVDGDVVLLTTGIRSEFGDKLVIYAPGEYEVSGVSIKGERYGDGIVYELLEEQQKILLGSCKNIVEVKDQEGYTASIVYADSKLDENALAPLSSEIIIVYGPKEMVTLDPQTIKRIDKVNLKKIDDLKGFVVCLGK